MVSPRSTSTSRAPSGRLAALALCCGCLGAPWLGGCAGRAVRIPRLEIPPAGTHLDPRPPAHVMWLRIAAARVPERDRNGQPFDEDGPPDPMVVLSADGRELLRTEAVTDSIAPLWPEGPAANFELPAGTSLLVQILDADGMSEQSMVTATIPAPKLEDAVRGSIELAVGAGAAVRLALEPARAHYGLGFSYQMRSNQCFVTARFEHGPAGRAGMRVGDRIVVIDGSKVSGMTPAEVRSHFGSVPSTGIELQVIHSSGTSETVKLAEGPVYVLASEQALLE